MKSNLASLQQVIGMLLLCISLSLTSVQAQMKVGQPAGPPNPSAALDVSGGPYANGSIYRGIAPPKVALTQTTVATPVSDPTTGLLVYNTAKAGDVTPGYYYWEGDKWLRFTTSSVGAARVAVNGQSIPAYLISQVSSISSPDIIYIADPGREDMFRYVSGSTVTADGYITLNAVGGRYMRIVPNGIITPQMFGAIANDANDDGAALQAWLNTASSGLNYELYLPAGSYLCSINLTLPKQGTLSVRGAGSRLSTITFTGDTDGITITNGFDASPPQTGPIHLRGFSILSSGAKSIGHTGLTIYARSAFQEPGGSLEDISFRITSNTNEFTTNIHMKDCLLWSVSHINMLGALNSRATGFVYDNSNDEAHLNQSPAENTHFSDIQIQNISKGFQFEGWGKPAVEGISLSQVKIVGVNQGITAVSHNYRAPLIGFNDVHIDATNECVILDNFIQTEFSNCLFYQRYTAGTTNATSAVKLNAPIAVKGDMTIWTIGAIPYALDIRADNDSLGDGVKLDLMHITSAWSVTSVHNALNVGDVEMNVQRYLTGTAATGGSNTGTNFFDESNRGTWSGMKEPAREVSAQNITLRGTYGFLDAGLYGITPKMIVASVASTSFCSNMFYHHRGQMVTVKFLNQTLLKNGVISPGDVNCLLLATGSDRTVSAGTVVSFIMRAEGWEEIASTGLSPSIVQGDTPISRATRITNPNVDLPSGFYTIEGNAYTPPSPANGYWYLTVNHHQNSTASPGAYRWDMIYQLGTGLMYEREVSPGNISLWNQVHSSRWFNVAGNVANTNQSVLWNNGANWTNAPYTNPAPTVVSASTQMVSNTKYQANGSSQLVLTLPLDANMAVGDQIQVVGVGAGGWKIAQNANQIIHTGIASKPTTTSGASGSIAANNAYDTITIEKASANHYVVRQYSSVAGFTIL